MGIDGRLKTTGAITRTVRATDSQGGYTITTTAVGSVPCRISMKSATERVRADKEEGLGSYKVFTLAAADVQVGDTLTASGLVYEIIAVNRPSRGTHLEWEAEIIESRA